MTLSRSDASRQLEGAGLRAKRALGQNFVVDANTVRRIARLARIDQSSRVIEIGAGSSIGTMRALSERLAVQKAGYLIRINPREPEIPAEVPGKGIALGAREALHRLAEHIQ